MSRFSKGQTLKVITTTIQRTTGAAWQGDKVTVVDVTGDGLKVKTSSGVILDRVKDNEVDPA